jgi:predicted polyphosphate/ATP-dependent NAD kinase
MYLVQRLNTDKISIGLIVNPVAGMGGAVGLKGTDGQAILDKAKSLGAKPTAPAKVKTFLSELSLNEDRVQLVVGAGDMGEDESKSLRFNFSVLGERKEETSAEDTREIATRMVQKGVTLIAFCGGDGTARDILQAVGTAIPVLGVPTGVKMHSAVFAVTPQAAAIVVLRYLTGELPLREAEVMDVDEEAFRSGRLSAELFGYVLTPYEPHLIQANKLSTPITETELRNQVAVAIFVIEKMEPDFIYVIGPGTTTRTIGDLLDAKKTLLGVDLFCDKKLVASDVNEKRILEAIRGKTARIIVTPIGGQGFIFGRGNQQISPEVIRQVGLDNIVVVATEFKMRSLRGSLKVDTGDSKLDKDLRARKQKVVADYGIEYFVSIE